MNLRLSGGGGEREGIVREFGMDMYRLLYLKWITSKDLLYSTRNSGQYYVSLDGRGVCRRNGYMCMYGCVPSLFTSNYHIVNQLYPSAV